MRIEVHFRHMDRSEALEKFATEKVEKAVEGFANRHEAHIQLWLVSDINLTSRSHGSFICEIDVRYPPRKDFFIHKASDDMYVAIQEAVDKLKASLNNAGKRETAGRGRAPQTELRPAVE